MKHNHDQKLLLGDDMFWTGELKYHADVRQFWKKIWARCHIPRRTYFPSSQCTMITFDGPVQVTFHYSKIQDSRQLRHWPRSVSSNWAAWQASILELSPQQLSQPTLTLEGAAQRQSAVSDSTILDSAGSAQTRAIPTVARPIFLATMIGHVKTIQKLMPACFRSNCRSIWRIFNEMHKASSCYFRPTRAQFKWRTPNLCYQDDRIC